MSRSLYTQGQFITPKNLFFGETLLYDSFSALFERMISQFGILLTRQAGGTYSNNALVSDNAGTSIDIQAFEAIIKDADGIVKQVKETGIVNIDMSNILTYPNNTYNILLQKKTIYTESGTITFTYGSNQVVGVGTFFTKNLDKFMNLIIDSSISGNNNKYAVLSVEDDTHLTLQQIFTGTTEGSLQYAVGGRFPDAAYVPATIADYRIYQYDSYEIVITTNAPATGQYRIATVVKAGGVLTTVTDKRTADGNYVKFSPTDISGAQISSGTVEVARLPVANGATSAGIVSITTQIFSGDKHFLDLVTTEVAGAVGTRVRGFGVHGDGWYPFFTIGDPVANKMWDIGYDNSFKLYFATNNGAVQTDLVIFSASDVTIKKPLHLGSPSAVNGEIVFYNDTSNYTTTLSTSVAPSDLSIALPAISGTIALIGASQDFLVNDLVATSVTTITLVATNFNLVTVNVGVASTNNGSLVIFNNLNAFKTTIVSSTTVSDKVITFPDLTGNVVVSFSYFGVQVARNQSFQGTDLLIAGIAGSLTDGELVMYKGGETVPTNIKTSATGSNKVITFPNLTGTVVVASAVNVVSPTAPNRTLTIDIGGTAYYIAAKTTND
jgi:hypothetical protein